MPNDIRGEQSNEQATESDLPAETEAKATQPGKRRKVAVLVVHGVAGAAARQSLDRVTGMLTSYQPPGAVYVRFGGTEFPLTVNEADVHKLVEGAESREEDFDRGLMYRMLRWYKTQSWEKYFKLERNEVRRQLRDEVAPEKSSEVHIYECFWADLSRGGLTSFFTKFVEFYQFLLDLCGLGRKSLYYAFRTKGLTHPLWWVMRALQGACEFIITGTIPALNILLIAVLLFSPVACQNENFQRWFFPVCASFCFLWGMAYWIGPFSKLPAESPWRRNWVIVGTLTAVVIGVAVIWIFDAPPENKFRTIALATSVGWSVLLLVLLRWAQKVQEIRWRLAVNLYILIPFTWLVVLWAVGHHPHPHVDIGKRALLKLSEALMAVGQLSWFGFFAMATLLVTVSLVPIFWSGLREKRRAGWRSPQVRALHTLQISTSLAGLLILLVTLCAWQIVPYLVVNLIKLSLELAHNGGGNGDNHPIVHSCDFLRNLNQGLAHLEGWLIGYLSAFADGLDQWIKGAKHTLFPPESPNQTWTNTLHQIGNQLFPFSCQGLLSEPPSVVGGVTTMLDSCSYNQIFLIVLALIAALAMTCIAFKPVIDIEIKPPADRRLLPEMGTIPGSSGGTLDEAFDSLRRIGTFITWVIMALTSVSFVILEILSDESEIARRIFRSHLAFPGFLVICGVVLVFAIAKLFGPILSVILDVINWLREKPRHNTPRARIVARMLAMLDAIAWAHEYHGYDQLIIVAHSQGTVITVETLRALKVASAKYNPFPKRGQGLPKITLFTMGSPLRQLYACRFPHLFKWVDDPPEGAPENCPNPSPEALYKIKQWVNAYGSMDYVGRALWHRPSDGIGGLPEGRKSYWQDKAVEVCLGEMAHTHYWDHGSIIAEYLDEIIEKGSFSPKNPVRPQTFAQ